MKLIECVPNISEGRDRAVIDAVTAVVADVEGAALLDVDPGEATNRTVITIAGPQDAVEEAAFRLIAKAAELIDMSKHSGEPTPGWAPPTSAPSSRCRGRPWTTASSSAKPDWPGASARSSRIP